MTARVLAVVVCFVVAGGAVSRAIFVRPDIEDVPTERLIANLEKQVDAAPSDAALRARLARVHALAYAQGAEQLPADRRTGEPWFGTGVPTPPRTSGQASADAKRREHLSQAIVHYRKSLELAPTDAVVRLGYAWALDQSGDRPAAIREYRQVIERAWPKEREKRAMMPGDTSLAVEAGSYLEKLLDPAKDGAELAEIRARREHIAKLPRAITPIVVPLDAGVELSALVARDARVLFDADGTALPRRWSWITPRAAWLVFDPRRTGRVTSALQLFGSVTFWTFWPHGYEALGALDDDGSGDLRGSELAGLALWHDRNSNGRSEPGEVRPIEAFGIAALSVRADLTCHPDVFATAAAGVEFANGARRPTYDVILRSAGTLTN